MLGGQWTGLPGVSGVWPTMHTNTSRVLTAFSDLEHEADLFYPSARDILAYLHRYAETFDLRVTRPVRQSRRPGQPRWLRMACGPHRHDRAVRPRGGGHR